MSMGIRHVGLYVRDLQKMIDFYSKLFGFTVIYRNVEEGEITDNMFARRNVRIDVCKMTDEHGNILELIQSLDTDYSNEKPDDIRNAGQIHIAYTVQNAKEILDRIVSLGGTPFNKPVTSADNAVSVFFACDIEGNYLEIVEERNGK